MLESDYLNKMNTVIYEVSDPVTVNHKLIEYCAKLNHLAPELLISTVKNKKYMIKSPISNKMVHFGDIRYQDHTKHLNISRRRNYLLRATKIKGDWNSNPFSANNLSINLLW